MEFYVITREMAVSLDRRYKLKQCNNTNLLGKGCLRNFIPMILTFVDRSWLKKCSKTFKKTKRTFVFVSIRTLAENEVTLETMKVGIIFET